MKFLLSLITVLGSSSALAEMDMQTYMKQMSCTQQINSALGTYGFGMNPEGPAFSVGADGKTIVHDSQRVVSRTTSDGIETIVYKVKEPRFVDGKQVFETVRKTVRIKRDGGKVVEVANDYDIKSQLRMREDLAKSELAKSYKVKPFPLMKSAESKFIHNGDSCETQQSAYFQMQDEKSPVEGKVTFDKKFCDEIKPMISRMGTQNASQCGNLIAMAQGTFEKRNKELSKENKELFPIGSPYGWAGSEKTSAGGSINLGMMVSMCATASDMANGVNPWGMGMGMYGNMTGVGGIVGMPAGGIMGGPVQNKQKPAKENSSTGTR